MGIVILLIPFVLLISLILFLRNKSRNNYIQRLEIIKPIINGNWIIPNFWSFSSYICRMEGIYKGRKVRCGVLERYKGLSVPQMEMKLNNGDTWIGWGWQILEVNSYKEQLETLARYCEKIEKGEEPPPDTALESIKYAWRKLWKK